MARKRALVGPDGDPSRATTPADVMLEREMITEDGHKALAAYEVAARVGLGRSLEPGPWLGDDARREAYEAAQLDRWRRWGAVLMFEGRLVHEAVERIASHYELHPDPIPDWIKPGHTKPLLRAALQGVGVLTQLWRREGS